MKKFMLLATVVAVMAAGVSATTGVASNGSPTPGCQSSTWDITLAQFGGGYHMNPLVKCHPTADSKGAWILSGSASVDGGCSATISGTLKGDVADITWNWGGGCTGTYIAYTGTLIWGDPTTGSGSGNFTTNCCGGGTWTATRTS